MFWGGDGLTRRLRACICHAADSLSKMLKPYDTVLIRGYPVSTRVNQVLNEDADCAKPVEPDATPTQAQLF
jgi:hypothetical protein